MAICYMYTFIIMYDFDSSKRYMICMQNMHQQITSAPVTSSGAGHPWGHRYWRWLHPARRHVPGSESMKVCEGDSVHTCKDIHVYYTCIYIYKHIYANCIVKCNNPETNRVTDYSPHMISYYQDVSSMTRWSGSILNRLQSDQSTPWKDTNSDYVNVCDTFAVIWTIV